MPKADFVPERDGFHFANEFVNVIAKFPGYGTLETGGRCGGMAYAALDYWFNGRLPIPADAALPHDGTLMADYIYKRLLDTYTVPSAINFITWTLAGDGENFFHKGVTRWTKEGEFPKLRAMVDTGKPQVLGLVKVTDLRQIGEDHQVVGYGYEDDGKGNLSAYVWDNRYPDREVRLTTTAKAPHWTLSEGNEMWRGWFIQGYGPKRPEFLEEGALLQEKGASAIHIVFGGAKFAVPSVTELQALGHNPRQVRQVGAGSLAYIADVPANGTLLKERSQEQVSVIEDGTKHAITSTQAMDAHGYSKDDVRTVPDGGLDGIPDGNPIGV
jgi:hypothetical protein